MHKRYWCEYNKKLVQRGSLAFLIDSNVMKTLAPKVRKKRQGRPLEFSDQLILLLLMIKIHCKMPYRMLEGFTLFFFERTSLGSGRGIGGRCEFAFSSERKMEPAPATSTPPADALNAYRVT
jgi:hypothetical protein